jgi:hypothetical protein
MLVHSDPDSNIFPIRPLCVTLDTVQTGQLITIITASPPIPVHVEGYARYRCYVPPRSFPRKQHTRRARGIQESDSRPCNLESTAQHGTAELV